MDSIPHAFGCFDRCLRGGFYVAETNGAQLCRNHGDGRGIQRLHRQPCGSTHDVCKCSSSLPRIDRMARRAELLEAKDHLRLASYVARRTWRCDSWRRAKHVILTTRLDRAPRALRALAREHPPAEGAQRKRVARNSLPSVLKLQPWKGQTKSGWLPRLRRHSLAPRWAQAIHETGARADRVRRWPDVAAGGGAQLHRSGNGQSGSRHRSVVEGEEGSPCLGGAIS